MPWRIPIRSKQVNNAFTTVAVNPKQLISHIGRQRTNSESSWHLNGVKAEANQGQIEMKMNQARTNCTLSLPGHPPRLHIIHTARFWCGHVALPTALNFVVFELTALTFEAVLGFLLALTWATPVLIQCRGEGAFTQGLESPAIVKVERWTLK